MFDAIDIAFGRPWRDLDLSTLQAFFAAPPHERLHWDAKQDPQDEKKLKELIWRHCCGFANASGGALVIGVEEDQATDGWRLRGLRLKPRVDPPDWVSSIVRVLEPVPVFDVRMFSLSSGAILLVIGVEPIATPPCTTPDGVVHQRQGNQTVKLKGPEIRRLAREGAAVRSAMRRAAKKLSRDIASVPVLSFGVALATLSRPDDVSVFKDATRSTIRAAIEQILRPQYPDGTFVALNHHSGPPLDPPAPATGIRVDNHSWIVSVHPQRQTTGVMALGRADAWIPPLDSGPEEFLRWVRVARDIVVATEQALGTTEGTPCYIAISKVRGGVRRLARQDAYATVVDDRGLGYAESGWTSWLRSQFGRLLSEFA
jgi:hypothetical protein